MRQKLKQFIGFGLVGQHHFNLSHLLDIISADQPDSRHGGWLRADIHFWPIS